MATKTESLEMQAADAPASSLLDQIVASQAAVASRYQPVMSSRQAIERREAIKELKNLVLNEGEDYGVIPGTNKPSLLKPGAEKICAFFAYVPHFETMAGSIEDWKGERFGEPLFYYRVRCTLAKDNHGVGEGTGSCNSWETKYRYRSAQRVCPSCGAASIIKGKEEYGGGWLCFAKKGGCGAKFKAGDASIEGQATGQVSNPDIADIVNTVQKMADKRAYIAATLSATGASQWFTQDVEDMGGAIDTGGHPTGTQAAANAVCDRKLAEIDAKQQDRGGSSKTLAAPANGSGKPVTQAPPPPAPGPAAAPKEDLPEGIQRLYVEMGRKGKTILAVFERLKAAINEVTGSTDEWYRILDKHEMLEGAVIKVTRLGQAHDAGREMVELIEALAAPPLAAPPLAPAEVDKSDWLPAELFDSKPEVPYGV